MSGVSWPNIAHLMTLSPSKSRFEYADEYRKVRWSKQQMHTFIHMWRSKQKKKKRSHAESFSNSAAILPLWCWVVFDGTMNEATLHNMSVVGRKPRRFFLSILFRRVSKTWSMYLVHQHNAHTGGCLLIIGIAQHEAQQCSPGSAVMQPSF